jgi:hypothetical protein
MEIKEKIHVVRLADGTIAGIVKISFDSKSLKFNFETIYDYRQNENELTEEVIYT